MFCISWENEWHENIQRVKGKVQDSIQLYCWRSGIYLCQCVYYHENLWAGIWAMNKHQISGETGEEWEWNMGNICARAQWERHEENGGIQMN